MITGIIVHLLYTSVLIYAYQPGAGTERIAIARNEGNALDIACNLRFSINDDFPS